MSTRINSSVSHFNLIIFLMTRYITSIKMDIRGIPDKKDRDIILMITRQRILFRNTVEKK